jgi:hypothetical protein
MSITHGPANTPMVPPIDPSAPGGVDHVVPYAPTPTGVPSVLASLGTGHGTKPPSPLTPSCASERATTTLPLAQIWQGVLDLGVDGPSTWLQDFVDEEDNYAGALQDRGCATAQTWAVHETTGHLVDVINAHGDSAAAAREVDQVMTALLTAEGLTLNQN